MESEPHAWLAQRFEENRSRLRGVAYRLLGSSSDADDAVQETWFRLTRSPAGEIENLNAWLTTVVSRISLDMLRSRKLRREESPAELELLPPAPSRRNPDPEQEAVLADSVGLALLVVLNRLQPAERVAFVLHDLFAVDFEEIAEILGRSSAAARQLASRARREVRGANSDSTRGALVHQARVVHRFLTALRAGDLQGVLAVLDPEVIRLADAAASPGARVLRGADRVASESLTHMARAQAAAVALVDGSPGIVVAPAGKLAIAIQCEVAAEKITRMDVIADSTRLAGLQIIPVDGGAPDPGME